MEYKKNNPFGIIFPLMAPQYVRLPNCLREILRGAWRCGEENSVRKYREVQNLAPKTEGLKSPS